MVSKQHTAAEEGLSQDTQKILAALSYPIWPVALVTILIAKPKDKYARYHGFQGFFWGLAVFIISIPLWILSFAIAAIPYFWWFGWAISALLGFIIWLYWLVVFIVSIIFAVQAYQDKTFKIPLIYNLIPANARY